MSILLAISIGIGAILWIGLAYLNRRVYRKLFPDTPSGGMDLDLLTLLGPIGSIMLALCAALMLLLAYGQAAEKRVSAAPRFALFLLALIPWLGSAPVNRIFYGKIFPDSPRGMDLDLIVALGPIGTFMLLLCFITDRLMRICRSEKAV